MRAPKASLGNRSWTSGCETHMEVDENGRLRTEGQYFSSWDTDPWAIADWGAWVRRTFIPGLAVGSIYYTPGYSNGGWGIF